MSTALSAKSPSSISRALSTTWICGRSSPTGRAPLATICAFEVRLIHSAKPNQACPATLEPRRLVSIRRASTDVCVNTTRSHTPRRVWLVHSPNAVLCELAAKQTINVDVVLLDATRPSKFSQHLILRSSIASGPLLLNAPREAAAVAERVRQRLPRRKMTGLTASGGRKSSRPRSGQCSASFDRERASVRSAPHKGPVTVGTHRTASPVLRP